MKKLALVLTLVAAIALPSCSWFQGAASNPIAADFIDCTSVDIGKTVTEVGLTLLDDVLSIVQAGSAGWDTTLANLILHYGNDALACALKAADDAILAHPPHLSSTLAVSADQRARQFIASHGWKYKAGQVSSAYVPPAPAAVLAPDAAPMLAVAAVPKICHDNLCGMDNYCSCHDVGGEERCWSGETDCLGDADCCTRTGVCHGMRQDECTAETMKAFQARKTKP